MEGQPVLYVLFILALIGLVQHLYIEYRRSDLSPSSTSSTIVLSESSSNPTTISRVPSYVNSQGVDTISKCILTNSCTRNDISVDNQPVITNKPRDSIVQIPSSKKMFVESVKEKMTERPVEERAVVFSSGDGGFGNNILGLVSSFVIAALTDSKLYLMYPTTLDSLFNITDYHGNLVQKTSPSELGSCTNMRLQNTCFRDKTPFVNKLKNETIQSLFNHTHMCISSNCPLYSWMLYNEETYHQIVKLGLLPDIPYSQLEPSIHGFNLLSNVLRRYFIPKEHIQESVRKQTSFINKNNTSVAFHIRKGDKKSDFKESRYFLYGKDVTSFSTCPLFDTIENPLIFVASDSTEAKKQVVDDNPSRKVVVSSAVAHHSYSAVRKESSKHVLDNVLVDMLSLASCDYLIGTWKSTYSIIAGAFQGHLPYFVTRGQKCFIPKRIQF